MSQRNTNKVVIITGAGRGIGAATAKIFAQNNFSVVLVSRTLNQLQAVNNDIKETIDFSKTLVFQADISQKDQVQKLFKTTLDYFKDFHILINNAAIVSTTPFTQITTEEWDQIMAINLRGAFLCSQQAFRAFEKLGHGGTIINISSLAGIQGVEKFSGLTPYTVSKFGIVGLTESLAVEGSHLGIKVNCIAPGAVDTEMLQKAAPFLKTDTKPIDIAEKILKLTLDSEDQDITGQIIVLGS